MWFGAGVLLGLVAVASVVGFHIGHYAHLVAVAAGVAAGALLLAMAAQGNTAPLVISLLGADAVVTAGVGTIAYKGMRDPSLRASSHVHSVVGREGVAVSVLDPSGVVRVRGENWSATSLNGKVETGGRVQVISVDGIRLSVWKEGELELENGPLAGALAPPLAPPSETEGTPHS